MKRRGQLTLFVIIAIVVVVGIVGYSLFQTNLFKEQLDPETVIIKDNLLDCFNSIYATSLNQIGWQGGYYELPDLKYTEQGGLLSIGAPLNSYPYYYYEGLSLTPSLEIVNKNIDKMVDDSLSLCIEYENNKSDVQLSYNNFKTTSITEEGIVTFVTDLDLVVDYEDKSVIIKFENYPQEILSDLYDMYNIASFLTESLRTNNEWLPFSDLVELSESAKIIFAVNEKEDSNAHIIFASYKDDYYPEYYQFSNKYLYNDYEDVAPLV